jgi:hypothetical protein
VRAAEDSHLTLLSAHGCMACQVYRRAPNTFTYNTSTGNTPNTFTGKVTSFQGFPRTFTGGQHEFPGFSKWFTPHRRGRGLGLGCGQAMSSAMSLPDGWHTMRTHTSCCGAAAAAGPGTAGPGLSFGRPTGRLAAAAAAAASCSRCLRACRLASTSRSTSARSTSGSGRFSATRFTPKWKRLRCPGGRSGSAISGRFRMVLPARARVN